MHMTRLRSFSHELLYGTHMLTATPNATLCALVCIMCLPCQVGEQLALAAVRCLLRGCEVSTDTVGRGAQANILLESPVPPVRPVQC